MLLRPWILIPIRYQPQSPTTRLPRSVNIESSESRSIYTTLSLIEVSNSRREEGPKRPYTRGISYIDGHSDFKETIKQDNIIYSLYKTLQEINPLYKDIREEESYIKIKEKKRADLQISYRHISTYIHNYIIRLLYKGYIRINQNHNLFKVYGRDVYAIGDVLE